MELQTLMNTLSFKGKSYYFIKLLQYTEAMEKYNNKSLFWSICNHFRKYNSKAPESNLLLRTVSSEVFSPQLPRGVRVCV